MTARDTAAFMPRDLLVLGGPAAIAITERVLCGDGVSATPAAAEGLASTGCRAASIARGAVPAASATRRLPASCVHHHVGATGPAAAAASGAAFVLVASSTQEAVDHCLLGHMLSARLGGPGLCAVDAGDSLESIAVPLEPSAAEGPGFLPGDPEPGVSAERTIELASAACDLLASRYQRPPRLLERSGPEDATIILAGAGRAAAASRVLSSWMQQAAHRVATLSIALLHPFPADRIRRAVAGARVVVAVEEPGAPGLLAALSSALGPDTPLLAIESPASGRPEDLAEAIRSARPDLAFTVPTARGPTGLLDVLPGGNWAEEIGAAFLKAVACSRGLRSARRVGASGRLSVSWSADAGPGGTVLVVAHPDALDSEVAGGLPAGSAVVVPTVLPAADDLARSLGAGVRARLAGLGIRVAALPRECARVDQVCGAVLEILDPDLAVAAARALEARGDTRQAAGLAEGAASVALLDPEVLAAPSPPVEVDFRAGPVLPVLPQAEGDLPEYSPPAIRRFHRDGRMPLDPPDEPLRPAALVAVAHSRGPRLAHPALLLKTGDGTPIGRLLHDVVADGTAGSGVSRTLSDNIAHVVRATADLLGACPLGTTFEVIAGDVAARLASDLGLAPAEADTVSQDLVRVAQAARDAVLFDLRMASPFFLLLRVLEDVRGPRRDAFARRATALREGLADLLRLDRMRAGGAGGAGDVSASMGAAGSFFVPSLLAGAVTAAREASTLPEERRHRIEEAHDCLDEWLSGRMDLPRVLAIVPPGQDGPGDLDPRGVLVHSDPLSAAVGVFDGLARRALPFIRAARTAELELAGAWRPDVHGERIAGLDWEGLGPDEMVLLPPVAVVVSGSWLRASGQGGLARLLRSGRPVLILVLDQQGAADQVGLSEFHGQLGWEAVGYREALVVQAPLVRPCRLVEGLVAMARATRPALGVVSLPQPGPPSWQLIRAEAALAGRSSPGMLYDPDAGPDWADRLDVLANPQPERDWPSFPFACQVDGRDAQLDLKVTHAHAVALDPQWRDHFRVIGRGDWAKDQLLLPDYLDRLVLGEPQAWIPYIWVHGAGDRLRRAVLTRDLAVATLDRRRAWRVLQELAGYDNAHARRASAQARAEALAEAERRIALLEAAHAAELARVKEHEARSALERLADALLHDGSLSAPIRVAAKAPSPDLAGALPGDRPAVAPAQAPAQAAADEAPLALDDPYVDTPLCTSCNECTTLNKRLFVYDGNKQAMIGDVSAGTFAELVRAAEKCPAKCIHPGKPRQGDPSATPEIVARAASFR